MPTDPALVRRLLRAKDRMDAASPGKWSKASEMYAHLMHAPAKQESRMSKFIRVFHRWTSVAFTLVSGAIFAMLAMGQEVVQWLYYVPLLPLFLLFITGLYMFFLPYVMKARRVKAS